MSIDEFEADQDRTSFADFVAEELGSKHLIKKLVQQTQYTFADTRETLKFLLTPHPLLRSADDPDEVTPMPLFFVQNEETLQIVFRILANIDYGLPV